ncbi:hypothetical protein GCM10010271_41120 [Streptomyces kurssanovii]|nr:hypothetical protein GCM10010271_41120 [Streptomyces kurssanovii]
MTFDERSGSAGSATQDIYAGVADKEKADAVGFGKAAPGASYRTVFVSAKIGGLRGIFRSTNGGADWTRINDDAHQWGWTGASITGDPRVYGRVYVSTNGRGIQYGESSDGGGTDPGPDPDPDPDPPGTRDARSPTRSPTSGPAASRPM